MVDNKLEHSTTAGKMASFGGDDTNNAHGNQLMGHNEIKINWAVCICGTGMYI